MEFAPENVVKLVATECGLPEAGLTCEVETSDTIRVSSAVEGLKMVVYASEQVASEGCLSLIEMDLDEFDLSTDRFWAALKELYDLSKLESWIVSTYRTIVYEEGEDALDDSLEDLLKDPVGTVKLFNYDEPEENLHIVKAQCALSNEDIAKAFLKSEGGTWAFMKTNGYIVTNEGFVIIDDADTPTEEFLVRVKRKAIDSRVSIENDGDRP